MSDVTAPDSQLRFRYYLFDIRLPSTYVEWAERDIASNAWLMREVARFLVLFIALMTALARWRFTIRSGACLVVGVAAIVAGQGFLRKVAVAYQRYGWDWGSSGRTGLGPYVRMGFAILFTIVFILLTR